MIMKALNISRGPLDQAGKAVLTSERFKSHSGPAAHDPVWTALR
jgi:hypothetical protein